MIRKATVRDLEWMANKSFNSFNEVYTESGEYMTPCILKRILHIHLKHSYVMSDHSAFIATYVTVRHKRVWQVISAWFSEKRKTGNGLKLFRHVTKKATQLKAIQAAILHRCEEKLKRLSSKTGWQAMDDNKKILVWRDCKCHQMEA